MDRHGERRERGIVNQFGDLLDGEVETSEECAAGAEFTIFPGKLVEIDGGTVEQAEACDHGLHLRAPSEIHCDDLFRGKFQRPQIAFENPFTVA